MLKIPHPFEWREIEIDPRDYEDKTLGVFGAPCWVEREEHLILLKTFTPLIGTFEHTFCERTSQRLVTDLIGADLVHETKQDGIVVTGGYVCTRLHRRLILPIFDRSPRSEIEFDILNWLWLICWSAPETRSWL